MLAQAYHRTEDDDPDTAPPDERLLQSHISIAGFADMHRIVMASNIGASVWEWETKKKPEVFMDSICENAAMKGLLFAANSDDVVVYDLSTGRKEPPQTGWHNAADANALAISDKWVACAIGGTRPNAGVWRAQNDKLGIELYSMSQVRESLLKQLAIEKQAETMAQAAGQAGSRRGPMTRPGTGPTSMRGKN
jgi:hypothetical protein